VCAMPALTAFMSRGALPGAQLQHTCAAHPAEVQVFGRQGVSCVFRGSAHFWGFWETRKTTMVRNVLTPEIQPFEPLLRAAGCPLLRCPLLRPIASGGRVFPVCFGGQHMFGDFGRHVKLQWFAMC
jgi:hypothetical protein